MTLTCTDGIFGRRTVENLSSVDVHAGDFQAG
jgi:hypothetical protein